MAMSSKSSMNALAMKEKRTESVKGVREMRRGRQNSRVDDGVGREDCWFDTEGEWPDGDGAEQDERRDQVALTRGPTTLDEAKGKEERRTSSKAESLPPPSSYSHWAAKSR